MSPRPIPFRVNAPSAGRHYRPTRCHAAPEPGHGSHTVPPRFSFLARLPPQEVRRPFNRTFAAAGTKVRGRRLARGLSGRHIGGYGAGRRSLNGDRMDRPDWPAPRACGTLGAIAIGRSSRRPTGTNGRSAGTLSSSTRTATLRAITRPLSTPLAAPADAQHCAFSSRRPETPLARDALDVRPPESLRGRHFLPLASVHRDFLAGRLRSDWMTAAAGQMCRFLGPLAGALPQAAS
jgi:hypothetical protein